MEIKKDDLAKIVVPVPPLPVQEEIVRILDSFSSLEAELEAELEARRKQYAYYRNELLTFDRESPMAKTRRSGFYQQRHVYYEKTGYSREYTSHTGGCGACLLALGV